jgi:hypothetical protein
LYACTRTRSAALHGDAGAALLLLTDAKVANLTLRSGALQPAERETINRHVTATQYAKEFLDPARIDEIDPAQIPGYPEV